MSTQKPFSERRQWYIEYRTTDGLRIEPQWYVGKFVRKACGTGRRWLLPLGLTEAEVRDMVGVDAATPS